MNKELLSKMAADMQLFRFVNETNEKFAARVIFSGMAMWMKAIALDGYQDSSFDQYSVSKKHHTERSTHILSEFLIFMPETKEWFYDEATLKDPLFPIHDLQNRLFKNGELTEITDHGRIAIVQPCIEEIFEKLVCLRSLHNGVLSQYNGIVSVSDKLQPDKLYIDMSIDTMDFLKKCIMSASFITDTWRIEKEYYNPFIKTGTFYRSWARNKVEQMYCISRIETGIKQHRYFIETTKNGVLKSSKIDDFIIESGNLGRLLLALRYKANNPLIVTIIHFDDHFELKRHVKSFPYPEEAVFRAFGWPMNSISDNQNFCYHKYMLPIIKKELENLLIKISEVAYE